MAIAIIFHLIAVVHFYFGLYYDLTYMTGPDTEWRKYKFGGRLIYLTIWNLIMQCIYFTFALLNDFIGSNDLNPKKRPLIRKIRDFVYGTYAFPFAMNVGVVFHVLFNIDRSLVMPVEVDEFFPWWLNHLVHTNIMIFILIELFFLPRQYPSRKAALTGIAILTAIYLGWVFCIHANTNFWVYGVLEQLNWPLRIAFLAFTSFIPVAFYFVGEFLNFLRWGKEIKRQGTNEYNFNTSGL